MASSERIISAANLNRYADSNLTPDEEMAFAILLWKFVRSTFYGDTDKLNHLIKVNTVVAHRAIQMAKQANCLNAFMSLNEKVRLLNLSIKDVEFHRFPSCSRCEIMWQTKKEEIQEKLKRYTLLNEMVFREKRNVTLLQIRVQDAEVGHQLVKNTVQQMQETAHKQISTIVTQCLQAIFGPRLSFHIRFEQKRNKTEAIMEVLNPEGYAINPMRACGGGVVDVISFALRVCALVLTQPAYRRLLVLDEPVKHLSVGYRSGMVELLKNLAEELQIQFIIVTHFAEFRVGKVIEIK